MHDDSVDRMTDGTGNVSSLTLAQIKVLNIDAGNNLSNYLSLKVPTFEEYLLTCKKNNLVPIIEIKITADITKIQNFVAILKKYNMEQHAVVISFGLNFLQEVRKYSNVKVQLLVNTITSDAINSIIALGNAGIDSNYSSVTQQNIIDCHNAGIEVNAWTVDNFDSCLQLVNWGIDYITSNKIGGIE
jgi:glycerophosphoryl diester phosphodiesterase